MRPSSWFVVPALAVAATLFGCAPAVAPAPVPAPAAAGGTAETAAVVARLDSIARAAVADAAVPGLSVAVTQGGRTLLAGGFGLAHVETGDSVRAETVFRSGSVTKQFTAAAIMRLAEQGRLSLEDDITRWLPDFPTQGHRVTVRHLLNHTSGIRSYTDMGLPWISRVGQDLSQEELVALFRDEPFDFAPGERFRYNNSGYFLLGMIIERASGRSYAEYIDQEFARPLGLANTLYCPNEPAAGHAHGYRPSPNGPAPSMPMSMTHPYSAGALCTTAADLVRWKHALADGRVVSAESFRRMVTPETLTSGAAMTYGFGLGIGDLDGERLISHSGGIFGFASVLSYFPEHGVAVAVLANSEAAPAGLIATRLARAALGLPEPEVRDLSLAPAERARYHGTYDLGPLQLRVFDDGDNLVAQGAGQPPIRLLAQGNHEFRASFDTSVRLVFRVEGERAVSMTLHQGGAVIEGRRVD
jgi:D-alanyl-D-alanine carboxypeptidase